MLSYYTFITLLSIAGLLVLCILVNENGRIKKKNKHDFYLTYLFIALAAAAEWVGVQLNGNADIPQWLLLLVKCVDYILTPMAGVALIRQMGLRNVWYTVLNMVIAANSVFQIAAAFFGWMVTVDGQNHYSHGPLYFVYVIMYLLVIAIVIIEFIIYGMGFTQQNRYSLYAIMGLVVGGIGLQELLSGEVRTAYIGMTLGAAMMYIHYIEYEQIVADDRINRQEQLLYRDSMTGLHSRYAYSQTLQYYEKKGTLTENFAAFSIDINGLKAVNDTMGHAAGDELICGAARCINAVFNGCGLCYRTGGDEFIVLAHADRATAEELLAKLSREAENWDGKLIHNLSLSAGYALACDHEGISAEKLVTFADKGMYADKSRYYRESGHDRRRVIARDAQKTS